MDVDDKGEAGEAASTLTVLPSAPSIPSSPGATIGDGERLPGAAEHVARQSPQAIRGSFSLSAKGSELDQMQIEAYLSSTKWQARAVVQSDGRVELLCTKAMQRDYDLDGVRSSILGKFTWIKALSFRVVKKLSW